MPVQHLPQNPTQIKTSEGRTVLDKTISVLGASLNMTPEDFSRLATLVGSEIEPIPVGSRENIKYSRNGTTFYLTNPRGDARMCFRNYEHITLGSPRNGGGQHVMKTEVEWNPQTWFSGQNVDHVIENPDEFLMLPSETLTYPFVLLLQRAGKKRRGEDKRVLDALALAVESAEFTKMSINLHSTPIAVGAANAFMDTLSAVWAWSCGTGLGGKDRMRVMDFTTLTGIRFDVWNGGNVGVGNGSTGLTMRTGDMTLTVYKKDVQARTSAGKGELRVEASLSGRTLARNTALQDMLNLPSDKGVTWYSSVECLRLMEARLGRDLEETMREVILYFVRRMGFPLMLALRTPDEWVKRVRADVGAAIRASADMDVRRLGDSALDLLLRKWLQGEGNLSARKDRASRREVMKEVLHLQEYLCGWSMLHFSRNAVDLLYHALAMATLSREEHLRMVALDNQGKHAEALALRERAYARAGVLRVETSKMRLLGR